MPKTARLAALFVLIIAGLATIAAAWGFQLIGGYVPCKLCLEQRVPFYVGLPLAVVALGAAQRDHRWLFAAAAGLTALVFAYGSALGVYQAGAEWGFWAGPSDCGGGVAAPPSATSLLEALKTTRVVSCTEASWRLLGLSFAGWNAVVSVGLAGLAVLSLLAGRRRST